MGMDSAVA
uniref:Uncharacterized protein n=1 Tax=Arundo donax TaxID=35708 RepID=A0A0A9H4A5_ARUDO